MQRLDNPHVEEANPAALRALRNAVSQLERAEPSGTEQDAALRTAYPVIPERVDEETVDFDYWDPARGDTPLDWNRESRMLAHELMRIAHEGRGDDCLLEMLEEERERTSAQLAFALADHEERVRNPSREG